VDRQGFPEFPWSATKDVNRNTHNHLHVPDPRYTQSFTIKILANWIRITKAKFRVYQSASALDTNAYVPAFKTASHGAQRISTRLFCRDSLNPSLVIFINSPTVAQQSAILH
jgi:hypothetical protein